MAATPIEQLKREALAGMDRLDATLANMPPLLAAKPKRWRSDVSDVAACAAVEGRTI
jgi:hypothetical protein